MQNPTSSPAARPVSGVENLNNTLSDVIRRINAAASRVGEIANQFGAPATDNASPPTTKEPHNTNEYMAFVDGALINLERITSRIDNQ